MSKSNLVTQQKIECGDCLVELADHQAGSANLVCLDPPYNFGQSYDVYDDKKSYEDYLKWARGWLAASVRVLHEYGSLWLFAPDEWVSELDMVCRHELKLRKRRQVIWAFTFGQKAQKNFTRSHVHLLYFTKHRTRFTFNDEPLLVPSARQAIYNDKRAVPRGKLPDDVWMLLKHQLEPYLTPDKDTWLASRVCGTYKEREAHAPNQIPTAIMERIVLATSNPGDMVVDPFAGTCSSGVACVVHGRNWVGYDISKECVRQGRRRLTEARNKLALSG